MFIFKCNSMKYYYLTIISLFFSISNFSQNTYIPDNGFEQLLIDLSIDFGPLDDYVPTANLAGLEDLFIYSNYNISDLTGIQDFTSIEALYIDNNPITTIDLSGNPILYDVTLINLNLTSLNLSNNATLARLNVSNNALTTIDFSGLPNLEYLNIDGNLFTTLDLSSKAMLTELYVMNNALTSLNIKNGSNVNIFGFDATNNPSLTCIEVDDAVSAISGSGNYSSWSKDATASYAENCNSLSEPGISFSNQITIYPNPVKNGDFLNFRNINTDFTLTIYDISGKLIDQKNIQNNNYLIANFAKGVYYYSIDTALESSKNKFIVY